MKYKVFLLNLDRSVKRLEKCSAEVNSVGLDVERISAVYGADLSDDQIAQLTPRSRRFKYHKPLNAGELGCYLSHRLAWQRILDEKLDFAVILEDDFTIVDPNVNQLITELTKQPLDWYYIKLLGKLKRKSWLQRKKMGRYDYVTFLKVPTLTGAQVVSRAGAAKLLEASLFIDRPIDVDLQFWWEKGLHIDGITPFPFSSRKGEQSEIKAFRLPHGGFGVRIKKIRNQIAFLFQRIKASHTLKRKLQ